MPRVSAETIEKLNEFFKTLPQEAQSKCALCNETLTHIVKTAEAQTGAGTATVTRELAERINEGAVEGDKVSSGALKQKVMRHEGLISTYRTNKNTDQIDKLLKLLKRAAKLAEKVKAEPTFSERLDELTMATSTIKFTLTETREGVSWLQKE